MKRIIAIVMLASICLLGCSNSSNEQEEIRKLQKQVEELQSQLNEQNGKTQDPTESITIKESSESNKELSETEEFLNRLEIGPLPTNITLDRYGEQLFYEIENFELTAEPGNYIGNFAELHYEIKATSLNELTRNTKIGDMAHIPAICYDPEGTLLDSFSFCVQEAGYGNRSSYGAYITIPKDTALLVFDVEGEGNTVKGTGINIIEESSPIIKDSLQDANPSEEKLEHIIENHVAIRSAAAQEADLLFTGTEGDEVRVVQYCDNGFTKILYNDYYCYIPDQFLTNSMFENSADFICPMSYREYLTEEDINRLTIDEIRLAINEIYARRGRIFKKDDMKSYFSGKKWYSPRFTPEEFDNSADYRLNCYERANISLLSTY